MPSAGATEVNGTWYCFGKKATMTVPTDPAHGTYNFNEYYAVPNHRDVIVGTKIIDRIWGLQPGDVACSRGGDDIIDASPVINPRNNWNRVKVDMGAGSDSFYDGAAIDDTSMPPETGGPYATFEVHTGPGNDMVISGPGNDQVFLDSNGRTNSDRQFNSKSVMCGDGSDTAYLSKYIWVTWSQEGNSDCEKLATYSGYNTGFAVLQPTSTVTTVR